MEQSLVREDPIIIDFDVELQNECVAWIRRVYYPNVD
jgi:hypothetical protein